VLRARTTQPSPAKLFAEAPSPPPPDKSPFSKTVKEYVVKKAAFFLLAMALMAAGAPAAKAADADSENKPVVVLSFAGYAELKRDLEYLGTLAGNPRMADGLEQLLLLFTQGQGLGGVDQARPWGAALSINSEASQSSAAFLPVSDFDKFIETLSAVIAEPVDAGDDVYEIRRNPNTYFLKHQGEWVYIAQQKSDLDDLPDDPLKQLRGLDKEYDLGVSINVQNVPQSLRDTATDLLMQGVEMQLLREMNKQDDDDEDEDEDEDERAMQLQLARRQAEQFVQSINELDQVTVGLNIDRAKSRTFIDLEITALPGTDTAEGLAAGTSEAQGTRLAGVLKSNAVLALHANLPLSGEDRKNSQMLLERVREYLPVEIDEEEDVEDKAETKQLVDKLIDVVEKTVDEEGRINFGLMVVASGSDDEAEGDDDDDDDEGGEQLTAVLAGVVADGARLEEVAKQLIALAKHGEAKLNAEKYKGHRFHLLSVPVPEDDELDKVKELVGDPLKVVLAFGERTCFVAVGEKGSAAIKQVIDRSQDVPEDKLPPITATVALAELLRFASSQNPSPGAERMAAMLKGSGKDHVEITITPLDNGVRFRLEGEEGVNKLLGSSLGNAAQMGGR
jgi:hypothetical protein